MLSLARASAVLCVVLVALTLPLSSARLYTRQHERPYTAKAQDSVSKSKLSNVSGAYSDESAEAGSVGGNTAASAPMQFISSISGIQLAASELEAAVWPGLDGISTPHGCPSWMLDYSVFHAQQRGQPAAR